MLLWALPFGAPAAAQPGPRVGTQLTGRVTASPDGSPLAFAIVTIEGSTLRSTTDSTGRFRLLGVPAGPQVLRVQRIGYALRRVDLIVPPTGVLEQDVVLARNALLLEGVRVVADPAGRAQGESGTASVIGSDAIRSQVAASLGGILELVPGTPLQPPGLDNVQQVSLRASPISGGTDIANDANAQSLSAFGTLLVLDGVPISNNANLQSLGPRGQLDADGTAGLGIDLRRLPAATIERVEVLRGVPSARWGDLTHGAVIVDTRAGEVPPEILARVDASTAEVSLLGGRSFGARHTLTLTSNVARTRIGEGARNDATLRFAGQLAHRWVRDGFTLDSRLDVHRLVDDRPEVPTLPGASSSALDAGFRLTNRLILPFGNGDRLNVTAALALGRQENWARRNLVSGVRALTSRTEPGLEVGRFGGGIYPTRVDVEGKPSFAYIRAEHAADRAVWPGVHEIRTGVETRREANEGRGTSFDLLAPPQSDLPGVRGFDRPRNFASAPAFALSGAYVDDRIRITLPNGSWAVLHGGVRLDVLHEGGAIAASSRSAIVQPRLNAEYAPVRWLSLRAGAGRMAKAPSMDALDPRLDYYDLVNVNYYANEPSERLAVVTTVAFDPANPRLAHTQLDRAEASVDLRIGKSYLSLTAFADELRGGFGTSPEPRFVVRDIYSLTNENPGSGVPPDFVLDPPARRDTIPVMVSRSANNVGQRTQGLELTADLPEFPRLRTRVALQGALIVSDLVQDRLEFPTSFFDFQSDESIPRIPYYESFAREGSLGILTTRLTHHQPTAGLIITVVVQHTLHQKRQNVGATDSLAFQGYLQRDGTLVAVPLEDRNDPQYADLRVPRALGTGVQKARPDWMLSLQVAKSLPLGGRFSFYAFNALERPGQFGEIDVVNNVFPGSRFGVELTMPLAAFASVWP